MNTLHAWAHKHGISAKALADIPTCVIPAACQPPPNLIAEGEAGVSARLQVEASERGWRLWRNNRGACVDNSGRHIRYGLANTSKRMGDAIRSADLIGIIPRRITFEDAGKTIGQFVSVEAKAPGVDVTRRKDKHTMGQKKWAEVVRSLGGEAIITSGGLG